AQSRGINVSSVRHDRPCDYQTMIRLTVTYRANGGDEVSRTIAGTLVAGSMPRIIEVQGIGVESDFPENLLYLR
ncbi:MAG: phosphoglycerate dehydrogenase, partial [Alphaproteobacteria bacterium]